ncbi:MAG: putative hydroxymethylpyrimidine transporter CytX [Eubacteriaceae bacterium]|jgi:putative hydroxymethylpyrimidine transporter CytX|nr:putative hydroxymethylpyrimidine transporter CytX [Eubacteriaceae bacterium]
MENKKTSVFENGLIWFGAAVSMAEIITGMQMAPLGFKNGILAILLGHLIGCIPLFLAGLIGAKKEISAMETVKLAFGKKGSLLFSSLNVLQLIGWTAVMIVSGAAAANAVIATGSWVWCLIIGALIIVWLVIGVKNLGPVNTIAMAGLFILTIVLSAVIIRSGNFTASAAGGMSFGSGVELAAAMPLSWLPLIADYTRFAEKKKAASAVSVVIYGITSCWMFLIGLGGTILTGQNDIAVIMVQAGLGIAGLVIIIFSTVTTTFLDAYSAGVSSVSINAKINEKKSAIVVTVMGTALAILTPITQITNFLYLIGSVFAPMIAIMITDAFILKEDHSESNVNVIDLAVWAAGFVLYRLCMSVDTPVGYTAPVMAATIVLCYAAHKIYNTASLRNTAGQHTK